MTAPAISVLMPVYNNGAFLREAVDSIIGQTFADFEILLYNDGSTDNTEEILASYNDGRLRVVNSSENKGLIHLLNTGISEARGKYIARMDGDDISMPDRFEKQFAFMDANPEIGICGTQLEVIGTGQNILRPTTDDDLRWWIFRGTPFAHPSVMIRASVLRENNLRYDPQAYLVEDYDLWWRMAKYCRIANLSDVLLRYRIHSGQESTAKSDLQHTNHMQSLNRFIESLGIDTSIYSAEMLNKFFSGELESNPKNLEWGYRFFKELEYSDVPINFFWLAKIKNKKGSMIGQLISYLVSYDKRLAKLIGDREFSKLRKSVGVNSFTWLIKSLVGWRTRVNR